MKNWKIKNYCKKFKNLKNGKQNVKKNKYNTSTENQKKNELIRK